MIQHHPDDDLLLAHAAGTLTSGPALLMASHVDGCAHCRDRLRLAETLGGALLDELTPDLLAPQALADTLAVIDAVAATAPAMARSSATGGARKVIAAKRRRPELPAGLAWPAALQGCDATRWRWLGPGVRWSRVTVPYDKTANVFLLRIGAGKQLPVHSHNGIEITQVLYGAFHDGRAMFGPGDFDEADGAVLHQPVVLADQECICLASVEGNVRFEGLLARTLGAMVRM